VTSWSPLRFRILIERQSFSLQCSLWLFYAAFLPMTSRDRNKGTSPSSGPLFLLLSMWMSEKQPPSSHTARLHKDDDQQKRFPGSALCVDARIRPKEQSFIVTRRSNSARRRQRKPGCAAPYLEDTSATYPKTDRIAAVSEPRARKR
jgi:hypothetical protein